MKRFFNNEPDPDDELFSEDDFDDDFDEDFDDDDDGGDFMPEVVVHKTDIYTESSPHQDLLDKAIAIASGSFWWKFKGFETRIKEVQSTYLALQLITGIKKNEKRDPGVSEH